MVYRMIGRRQGPSSLGWFVGVLNRVQGRTAVGHPYCPIPVGGSMEIKEASRASWNLAAPSISVEGVHKVNQNLSKAKRCSKMKTVLTISVGVLRAPM